MDYEQAKNTYENTRKRKLANNTYLEKGDGFYAVRLHSTQVIQFHPDKTVFNSGGYRSMTTRARIQEFSSFRCWQSKGLMYIGENFDNGVLFADNCYFDHKKGKFVGYSKQSKTLPKLRRSVLKFAKKYAELMVQGKIEKPNLGDCFFCQFTRQGQNIGHDDHILHHIRETYHVPSLLINAINEYPVSIACQTVIAYYWQNDNGAINEPTFFYDIARRQIEHSVKKYCLHNVGL